MDTIKINSKNVKMVAHRGVSGIEPQNTLFSFIAAGNRSYYGIETDIHITTDGRYVCIHDFNFKNVAGREDLEIEKMTYDEARAVPLYDATGKVNQILHIPSMEEYIETCKRYGKVAVLELKSTFTKEQIAEIIEIVAKHEYLDKVIFISFIYQNLVYIKELKPDQDVQFLTDKVTDNLLEMLQKYGMNLDIHYKAMMNKAAIKPFKKAGIEVNVWTVDNPEDAKMLIKNGVDYITSNILE